MKPAKGLLQFATWLMRFSVALFLILTFFHDLKSFAFKSIHFWVAVSFVLFSILLFIGGFMSKPGMTVFSGFMLFLTAVYKLVIMSSGTFSAEFAIFAMIASMSLYFVSAGNKN